MTPLFTFDPSTVLDPHWELRQFFQRTPAAVGAVRRVYQAYRRIDYAARFRWGNAVTNHQQVSALAAAYPTYESTDLGLEDTGTLLEYCLQVMRANYAVEAAVLAAYTQCLPAENPFLVRNLYLSDRVVFDDALNYLRAAESVDVRDNRLFGHVMRGLQILRHGGTFNEGATVQQVFYAEMRNSIGGLK